MFAGFMVQYVYGECFDYDEAAFARAIDMEETKVSSALLLLDDGIRDQELVERTMEYLCKNQKLLLLVSEQYEIHNENVNAPKSACPLFSKIEKRLAESLRVTPESAQRQRKMELIKQLSILHNTVETVFCGRNVYHTIGCKAHSAKDDSPEAGSRPCEALAQLIEVFYENLVVPDESSNPTIDRLDGMLTDE